MFNNLICGHHLIKHNVLYDSNGYLILYSTHYLIFKNKETDEVYVIKQTDLSSFIHRPNFINEI